MLNNLTKEQLAIMVDVRQEWLDRGLKPQTFDRQKFNDGIGWMYNLIGLKMPMIVEVDSPLGAQYAVWLIKKMLNGHINSGQVWDQVGTQVWGQVWDQVWDQVWGQVGDQVGRQVRDQVGTEKFEAYTSYGSIYDYGWVAFYDLFRRIGITLGPANDKFNSFVSLLMANHYDFIALSGLVVVCKKPMYIRMEDGRMHSTNGPCIEWADGYKLYAIKGRILPSWIWEQKDSITKERYTGEKNAEYRAGMYAVLGQQSMMKLLGAKKVDTCKDNDEVLTLYKTKESFDTADGKQPYAWVQCNCPSTGTTYMLGVKPHHKKAKAAMAELWGLTEAEYTIGQHT